MRKFSLVFIFISGLSIAQEQPDVVPTAHVRSSGGAQESVVSSFCWHFNQKRATCVDSPIATPEKTLDVAKKEVLELVIPNQNKLKLVQYSLVPVSQNSVLDFSSLPNRTYWNISPKEITNIEKGQVLNLNLDLKKGLYVLWVNSFWVNSNSASHGFLLNVTP